VTSISWKSGASNVPAVRVSAPTAALSQINVLADPARLGEIDLSAFQ
jgi:hypothetical protein